MDLENEGGLGEDGGDASRGSPEVDLKGNSRGKLEVSSDWNVLLD